jgi:hypothetical protein
VKRRSKKEKDGKMEEKSSDRKEHGKERGMIVRVVDRIHVGRHVDLTGC